LRLPFTILDRPRSPQGEPIVQQNARPRIAPEPRADTTLRAARSAGAYWFHASAT